MADVRGEQGNQRRWSACVSRTRRGVGTHGNGGEAVGGLPHRPQHPSCPAATHSTIALQSAGRLRGCERRGAVVRRSSVRHIVGCRASQPEKMATSSSDLGRFETEMLASRRNLTTLMNLPGEWVDSVSQRQPLKSETSCGRQGRVARRRADPCVGFIVTNLPWQAREVVKFEAPVERPSNGSKRARMPAGTSKKRAAVVADHAEGEARQDRCQGHPARQVRDVPACGSRRTSTTLRFDPRADQQT